MKKQALETQQEASTVSGASNAAKARSEKLTPERRSEIARKAAESRWNAPEQEESIPREAYAGVLVIRDLELPCAVLSNGERVLSERGVTKALGGKRGGAHWERMRASPGEAYRPVFMSANNLAPFIPASLSMALSKPVTYKSKNGRIGNGVPATLLPEICEVFLHARRAKALTPQQDHFAATAEILMSGLARVGIIALVDEVTGYQEDRPRSELHRILEAYIAPELLPWTRKFPDEFYKQLFRLKGWSYNSMSVKRPKMVGKLTAQIIYERLPNGILEKLRKQNPVTKPGGVRKFKHFQYLTPDIGDPHLDALLLQVIPLMRGSTSWRNFERLLERAIPREKMQPELDLELPEIADDDEDGD